MESQSEKVGSAAGGRFWLVYYSELPKQPRGDEDE